MVDIVHRVAAQTSSPETVYEALTTIDGLRGWWTDDVSGSVEEGGVIEFRFLNGGCDAKVEELRPLERVVWRIVDGPDEWVGTTVEFELTRHDDWTVVMFRHAGWAEPVAFMHHCSTKWGSFLMSLKSLAETGTGAPSPRDTQIGDWR